MERVLGHEKARQTLGRSLASGRTQHAWIFQGPAGVGKCTTAIQFAKTILCPHARRRATDVQACDGCRSCTLVQAGNHPDLHVIRKELAAVSSVAGLRDSKQRNVAIDLLRERMLGGKTGDGKFHEARVAKTAVLGHGKVFIIDEAELLEATAQNALLKTLEEPAAATYIILVVSSEQQLLATVRSRCQHLGFGALPAAIVERWLRERHADVMAEARAWLVDFADGSIGRAELALQYDLGAMAGRLGAELEGLTRGQWPQDLGSWAAQEIDEFAKRWVAEHPNASKEAANHVGAGLVFSATGNFLRKRLAAEAWGTRGVDVGEAGQRLRPYLRAMDALGESQGNLAANVNLGLVCDHLVSVLHRCFAGSGAA